MKFTSSNAISTCILVFGMISTASVSALPNPGWGSFVGKFTGKSTEGANLGNLKEIKSISAADATGAAKSRYLDDVNDFGDRFQYYYTPIRPWVPIKPVSIGPAGNPGRDVYGHFHAPLSTGKPKTGN